MTRCEFKPLVAVAESYIVESCPSATGETIASLKQIIEHFITNILSYDRASALFIEKAHTNRPVERISAILNVPESPISRAPFAYPQNPATGPPRRKTHPWSEYEDQRLLCAINRFGLDNWRAVAQFVGNQRTRAQCSQRWFRGLDPRISKVLWTGAEERQLLALVHQFGDRAWTRISAELGNRSDAQCRYRYRQLVKDGRDAAALPNRIQESHSAPTRRFQSEVRAIVSSMSSGDAAQRKLRLPSISDMMGQMAMPPFQGSFGK